MRKQSICQILNKNHTFKEVVDDGEALFEQIFGHGEDIRHDDLAILRSLNIRSNGLLHFASGDVLNLKSRALHTHLI